MIIKHATLTELNQLAPLFDAYRIFYRQASDIEGAQNFLKERLTKKDSIIFIAYIDEIAVGFTQLYFLLSSVSM